MTLTIGDLVGRGFFPQELPPPFNTSSLAKFLTPYEGKSLPFKTGKDNRTSKPEIYSLARTGTLRRELSILNPIHFSLLAKFIVNNWSHLYKEALGSRFTLTKPQLTSDGRAIAREHNLEMRTARRAELRSSDRFLLLADISRFYPSIYTHSIPWALHRKDVAKAKKSDNDLLGNKLDKLVRDCQDGQTLGIPIGPDTSLLIAEILLSKVDRQLAKKHLTGIRYIDDYELSFNTEEEAVRAQTFLEDELLKFELHLNPAKSRILPLPQQIEDKWVSELKDFALSPIVRNRVINFFDHAFELAREFPSEGVLRYAAGRIAKNRCLGEQYEFIEDLLIQCARVEAGSLPFVMKSILHHKEVSANQKKRRQDLLHRIILEHAPRRHSSEVAWSIWACIALDLGLPSKVMKPVLEMEDSVCALLLLHARSKRLATANAQLDSLQAMMTTDRLYDHGWLLAYEANVKNWLSSADSSDHVSADHNFGLLKKANVSFYDESKTILPDPADADSRSSLLKHLEVDYSAEESEDDDDEESE